MIVREVILTVPNQLCGFLEMRIWYQYIVALIKHGISLIRELNFKKLRQVHLAFHGLLVFLLAFELPLFSAVSKYHSYPKYHSKHQIINLPVK